MKGLIRAPFVHVKSSLFLHYFFSFLKRCVQSSRLLGMQYSRKKQTPFPAKPTAWLMVRKRSDTCDLPALPVISFTVSSLVVVFHIDVILTNLLMVKMKCSYPEPPSRTRSRSLERSQQTWCSRCKFSVNRLTSQALQTTAQHAAVYNS